MKTILLTGAAGFIGSNTASALLDRGDLVIGVDNLNDYYDPARKQSNLKEVRAGAPDASKFVFYEADIRDEATMDRLFAEHEPDVVIHLAAMAGVRASMDDPRLYFDVNLKGTLTLLEVAQRHGQPPFVFASTSSVYGRTKVIPFIETDRADRPLAPYPASKRAAELLGHSYFHLYGQNFTALRFFTVYGPRGRPDMMAYLVLDNIFTGKEVPLYNNGQMHRDWTFVDDIVRGIVAAADQPLGFEVVNLGRGEPILLADFVRLIEELAGKPSNLTDKPMPAADVEYTYANIDRAKELLGYAPKVASSRAFVRFGAGTRARSSGVGIDEPVQESQLAVLDRRRCPDDGLLAVDVGAFRLERAASDVPQSDDRAAVRSAPAVRVPVRVRHHSFLMAFHQSSRRRADLRCDGVCVGRAGRDAASEPRPGRAFPACALRHRPAWGAGGRLPAGVSGAGGRPGVQAFAR